MRGIEDTGRVAAPPPGVGVMPGDDPRTYDRHAAVPGAPIGENGCRR